MFKRYAITTLLIVATLVTVLTVSRFAAHAANIQVVPTPWMYLTNGTASVPTNALQDEATNAITDENANYILTE
jgi:hypothetical protein